MTIKRLSIYEKRLLQRLYLHKFPYKQMRESPKGTMGIETMRKEIKIPHRSSMSRLIKTLEIKGLVLSRPKETGGKYKKRLSLTPAGERVGYQFSRDDLWPHADEDEG